MMGRSITLPRVTRTLVSWIGNTDLETAAGRRQGPGPIGQVLKGRSFDQVLLLSNYPKEESAAFVRWAKPLTQASIRLQSVQLADPTHFAAIYKVVNHALDTLKERTRGGAGKLELTLHLSSGTPVMAAVWIILGKTRHPAELVQTSAQKGLQTTSVPLDIAAEFVDLLPELLRAPDASLERRSGGPSPAAPRFGEIVYRCAAMAEVMQRAKKVLSRNVAVLIEGESGTGKELLARAIHQEGARAAGPFQPVNCGAIPKDLVESELFGHKKGAFTGANTASPGYFRAAHGGTLFLDEIGELPLDAQVKLLRALQAKEVVPLGESKPIPIDVRVVAATNRNLLTESQAGRFREDLFYRLAVAVLRLPPLRERQGDVGLLIDALLDKANELGAGEEPGYLRKSLSPGARNLLLNHPWPGNVRELENTLMRATVWTEGAAIREQDARAALVGVGISASTQPFAPALGSGFDLDAHLADINRECLKQALKQTDGNKSRAAKLLGLKSRQTLNNRMEKLGVAP